jgi:hypothetical protein
MNLMGDVDRLRNRAKRMMELAQRARREGRGDIARLLAQLASEALEHATEMLMRHVRPPDPGAQQPAQQQQQPQPDEPDKKE